MTSKPSRVLIIGSGPTVKRTLAGLIATRFVDDTPGADDLAEEGMTSRVVILTGRIADG